MLCIRFLVSDSIMVIMHGYVSYDHGTKFVQTRMC